MRQFGHRRPKRNAAGDIIGDQYSPVCAVTREPLGGAFGPDKKCRLHASLQAGDLIVLRPVGTRRPVWAEAKDVYRWLLTCQANRIREARRQARKQQIPFNQNQWLRDQARLLKIV